MIVILQKVKYLLLFFLVQVFVVSAQPGNPGGDPDKVPITGIEILIGAGALVGAKKMLSSRKPK